MSYQKLFSANDAEKLVSAHVRTPSCTYCGSSNHSIQHCDVYNFHHEKLNDGSAKENHEHERVLARRKAHDFGGIPEIYLSKPTPEEAALVAAYRQKLKIERQIMVLKLPNWKNRK